MYLTFINNNALWPFKTPRYPFYHTLLFSHSFPQLLLNCRGYRRPQHLTLDHDPISQLVLRCPPLVALPLDPAGGYRVTSTDTITWPSLPTGTTLPTPSGSAPGPAGGCRPYYFRWWPSLPAGFRVLWHGCSGLHTSRARPWLWWGGDQDSHETNPHGEYLLDI